MNRILMTVAAAALVSASGVALAQQDAVNPAPNYAPTPAVQNHQVKHIEDGINAAPRYPTVAPAGNPKGAVAIQDGNNPAPIMNSASTTRTPQARRSSATKATGTVHAHQRTHNASHG
jgi:hypothetical protein